MVSEVLNTANMGFTRAVFESTPTNTPYQACNRLVGGIVNGSVNIKKPKKSAGDDTKKAYQVSVTPVRPLCTDDIITPASKNEMTGTHLRTFVTTIAPVITSGTNSHTVATHHIANP